MGMRNAKPPRSNHPLLVSAAAITRAIDPSSPSRITVIRLLADALHTIQELQISIDAAKARAASYASSSASQINIFQLEADSRARSAYEAACRALFTVTVAALLKLPSRGGPLRRRAIKILNIAAKPAGPSVAMAAATLCRSHIHSLKRLTWSSTQSADFEVVCAVLVLAELSSCQIGGRHLAGEAIYFMLTPRVRQKCKRHDLSHAIAVVVQSFPPHAPPDDRLVDNILQYTLSSSSTKQASSDFGTALLTAMLNPFLVSRGPQPSDNSVQACANAMQLAPSPTEKAMWALAMARASVTARRSHTYQLQKYGTAEIGSRFPRDGANGSTAKPEKEYHDSNPAKWVSNSTFQDALLQVATDSFLSRGHIDASIAVAAVLRMWSQALPDSIPIIIPDTLSKLMPELKSVPAVSTLMDALWLGLLKNLKPNVSATVLKGLLPALESNGLELAAILHLSAIVIAIHGRQALRESGVTVDFRDSTKMFIKRIHEALDSTSSAIRLSAARLMDAIVQALPRTCSQFLTTNLQNLRISDLALATKPHSAAQEALGDLGYFEPELSSLLGNAASLSVLIERVTLGKCSVPAVLKRQVAVDCLALLRIHHADQGREFRCSLAYVRRRAGWGLIAALARGGQREVFEGDNLSELMGLWKEELGYASVQPSEALSLGFFSREANSTIPEFSDLLSQSAFDHLSKSASTRSAALHALASAVINIPSPELEKFACSLSGACAAQIVTLLASINAKLSNSNVTSASGLISLSLEGDWKGEGAGNKKHLPVQIVQSLTAQCVQLVQCLAVVPPKGDAGELSYMLAIALAELSEKNLGEDSSSPITLYSSSTSPSTPDKRQSPAMLSNHRPSLYHLSSHLTTLSSYDVIKRRRPERGKSRDSTSIALDCTETGWIFSQLGIDKPSPEHALLHSSRAVAAIIAEDLTSSGSLIESLSSHKLSPPMSASICLELAKRLSRSDLAEINRALAMLQLLSRKSLTLTSGCHRSLTSQYKNHRIYTPISRGDGNCHVLQDVPGHALKLISQSEELTSCAHAFSGEGHTARLPFHNYHSRALGIMYANRTISAEAHRELSITGGPALWMGLMKRVISTVRDNIRGSSASQAVVLSNAIAALGSMLDVIPESSGGGRGDGMSPRRKRPEERDALDEMSEKAIDIIATAIEEGKPDVQAAAALALSSCSHRVASASDRLIGALLQAWSQDRGEFASLGHFGRCVYEADIWLSCFRHIWRDMGVNETGNRERFFTRGCHGMGTASPSLVTSAAAVVSSCRLHWWPIGESSHFSVKEMSTELLEWTEETSTRARAAGVCGMSSLWAAKIDVAQVEFISNSVSKVDFSETAAVDCGKRWLPAERFALKDPSRFSSPVGPFLDEVIYDALATPYSLDGSIELQDAATTAVLEIIRGAGAEQTCQKLRRLPESLFETVDCGIMDSRKAIKKLVKSDAAKRPGYWFGLCRAICLDGERLNSDERGTFWSVSLSTKRFAVEIASDALEISLLSCACPLSSADATSIFSSHKCSFRFIRKIFHFVDQICVKACIDYNICAEGCKLLQRVFSRVGSSLITARKAEYLLPEFKDVWEEYSPRLEDLLHDKMPVSVVSAALSAVVEKILLSLHGTDISESSLENARLFLNGIIEKNSRKRFLFTDQNEEVGMQYILFLIAKSGMLISALGALEDFTLKPGREKASVSINVSIRSFLYAACGDFVTALTEEGVNSLAINGGSVTSPLVSEKFLLTCLCSNISPIVFGAASSSCMVLGEVIDDMDGFWENQFSPGVRMASDHSKYSSVTVSLIVWLIKHANSESSSTIKAPLSYGVQCRQTLICLMESGRASDVTTVEALVSLAQWNQAEFFMFSEQIAKRGGLGLESISLMVQLTLSVLLTVVTDDFNTLEEVEAVTMARALSSLSNFSDSLLKIDASNVGLLHCKMIDVIVQATGVESDVVSSAFMNTIVQENLFELLRKCISRVESPESAAAFVNGYIKSLFLTGRRNRSIRQIVISLALAVALQSVSDEISPSYIVHMLTKCDSSVGEDNSGAVLAASIDCPGIEQFIVGILNSNEVIDVMSNNAGLLLHQLGSLAISEEVFSVSTALRCAIAAILVETEHSDAINKMGMVIYSTLLSRLIQELPIRADGALASKDMHRSEEFFVELVRKQQDCLEGLVSAMWLEEREKATHYLKQRNPIGKD